MADELRRSAAGPPGLAGTFGATDGAARNLLNEGESMPIGDDGSRSPVGRVEGSPEEPPPVSYTHLLDEELSMVERALAVEHRTRRP